jgi:hypothetical protein
VQGVEFSRKLHDVAAANIHTYRNPRQRCFNVASINLDAREYVFPSTPLVVYIFNPFRHELLAEVVERLEASLDALPRDVLVVYLNALDSYVFDQSRWFVAMSDSPVPNSRLYRSVSRAMPR